MSSIITVGTLLAQFAMVAIGTYMIFYSGLIKSQTRIGDMQRRIGDMQRRICELEADRIARQQYVPEFSDEVLDMASRMDSELEADRWDDDMRDMIQRISEDMWVLYADLEDIAD